MKTLVVINEQHSLLPQQAEILNSQFEGWEFYKVPAEGWDKEAMDSVMSEMEGRVVFCSPVPYMLKKLSFSAGMSQSAENGKYDYPWGSYGEYKVTEVLVFCNDKREKKELPNGKVISVTAREGWYLA